MRVSREQSMIIHKAKDMRESLSTRKPAKASEWLSIPVAWNKSVWLRVYYVVISRDQEDLISTPGRRIFV